MTTYQRLKAENLKFRRQLILLSTNPETFEATTIRAEWKFIAASEASVMAGDLNPEPTNTTRGISSMISDNALKTIV